MSSEATRGLLYQASTATFDFNNPSQALSELLELIKKLLDLDRVALYEYNEGSSAFFPRMSIGISTNELGKVTSSSENPVLKEALSEHHTAFTKDGKGTLSLPLTPGNIACAPCFTGGQTIGLIFTASDSKKTYDFQELAILDILSTRAAEILSLSKQSANQSFLLHKLSLLYQASHAITGTKDEDEAIRQTAIHLLSATSGDSCEILILNENGNDQTYRYRQQLAKGMQQTVTPLSDDPMPDYPIYETVLEKLQPVFLSVSPAKGSAQDIAIMQSEGISATSIFPLATGNKALGIVRVVYKQSGKQYDPQEIELAHAIVNIGAVGIQDALHLSTAKARANQLQLLGEIGREITSTLDMEAALENAMINTQKLLDVEACVLFLLDERGEKLVLKASGGRHVRIRDVAIRLEEGIAGWVTRNQKPLIVNDVRTNPLYHSAIDGQTGLLTNSVLCVPMAQRDEVLGVIEAINHPAGAFGLTDQQLLSSVAAWAAVALENANLFRRVTEERSKLEATLVETADAVVLTDLSAKIMLINQTACQAFRIDAEDAMGQPAVSVFSENPLGKLLTDDRIELPMRQEVTTPGDRTLHATISEISGVGKVVVMQDITAFKQIDRMRSHLLGTAAHDLKNPLNAIRLGADLLMEANLTDQQRKALSMMQRATDSMANLITSLLETIRVESTATLINEPCPINDLIRRAIEDLRPLANAKGHSVNFEIPSKDLVIMGDPERLNSVMNNLLSNAVKFTQDGGKIDIDATWDDETVTISVKDNGPGIPEEELPSVFDHLFRGRIAVEDPENPIDGTGLGLALAKTVIEQHGGQIWVESEEGKGSTFYYTLSRLSDSEIEQLKK